MENKHSTLTVAALVISGLSLIFALVSFGRVAGMANHHEGIKRELVQIQEMVRTEDAKLAARQSTLQRNMEAMENRLAELQVKIDNLVTCVRTGRCTGQLG